MVQSVSWNNVLQPTTGHVLRLLSGYVSIPRVVWNPWLSLFILMVLKATRKHRVDYQACIETIILSSYVVFNNLFLNRT